MPLFGSPENFLEWAQVIGGGISGGFAVKVFDVLYQEFRRRLERQQSSSRFVDQHLDPLLKAADELVGKLYALGREDFRSFVEISNTAPYQNPDLRSTVYLFARFWAQIEILRQQALYVSISAEERGRHLQAFLDCLESRKVRLIDRMSQRAAGETLLAESGVSTIRFVEFAKLLDNPDTARWIDPLANLLKKATHTTERQQILQYCVIMHAMIDDLDPDHMVTRKRPSIPNKLSNETWKDLNYRVFGTYLKFVKQHGTYIGGPKTSAATRRK